jgi:hypothetical protein
MYSSIDMAPSSREYGNVRRYVIDLTVRLLLTWETALTQANSFDLSRENTLSGCLLNVRFP